MTTPTIEFDARAVAPLYLFAAKHDVRYYLNGLCVMPSPSGKGCIVIGCDGHRLAMWHDPDGVCDQQRIFKITAGLVAACKKRRAGAVGKGVVRYEDGRLLVLLGGEEIHVQAGKAELDGNYPDIWRVIPAANRLVPGMHGYMNTEYLKTLGEAGKLALLDQSGRWSIGINHFSVGNDGNGSIVTRFDGAPHFMVITMPMRGRDDCSQARNGFPDWIPPKAPDTLPQKATAGFSYGSMGEYVAA